MMRLAVNLVCSGENPGGGIITYQLEFTFNNAGARLCLVSVYTEAAGHNKYLE
jgi:hypothetical protein